MNLEIFYQDSGLKKESSKAKKPLTRTVYALREGLSTFLKKNPHFKGVEEVTLTLTLCGKAKMKGLNFRHREKNKVTDVLSFGLYENVRPDRKKGDKLLPQVNLGDVVICREKAASQALEFGVTYEQEVIHLAVHGFLHLLGFDHERSSKEEKIMEAYENELVGRVYQKLKKI